ncbi:hypothetical protein Y032_0006g2878 [Ancylostoma ceylanicum]|uniref:Uncharacterized protein n=1 Tax=Ancylostoma ceylanicum TaxID=53326 RepID=A0A016VR68_9BILA|nr:hypothetical protein Y032_0006g2878 [Ancylostoma ceylanicum]
MRQYYCCKYNHSATITIICVQGVSQQNPVGKDLEQKHQWRHPAFYLLTSTSLIDQLTPDSQASFCAHFTRIASM